MPGLYAKILLSSRAFAVTELITDRKLLLGQPHVPHTKLTPNSVSELQPALDGRTHLGQHLRSTLTRRLPGQLGKLHRLETLGVDVTLLTQPGHTWQGDFVGGPAVFCSDLHHARQSQSAVPGFADDKAPAWLCRHAEI